MNRSNSVVRLARPVSISGIKIGNKQPLTIVAGPCVIESRKSALFHAESLKKFAAKLKVPFIFKASYDKANRTSVDSFRGVGIDKGLEILLEIKEKLNVPILSDVHSVQEIERSSGVLDILQIPAFLCRQTDMLIAAGKSKKVVNVKKGQFLSPEDMVHVIKKVQSTGNKKILLTERGVSFGYKTLVSDFRSIVTMREMGCPVIFDATHSVQSPGGQGNTSGGDRRFAPYLAKASVTVGADAVFMEVHQNPDRAKSDGPNSIKLKDVPLLWRQLQDLRNYYVKSQ